MMSRVRGSLLIAGVFALTAAEARAQNFDTVQVTTARLAEGVHVLFGAGGNVGVSVGPDGVILVDDQYAPLTPKIVAAVRRISDRPIKFVLNTHFHGDHSGGNENLGNAGALIVAHDNVRTRMSMESFVRLFNMRSPASPNAALPVVTFSRDVTFHLNGDDIRAFHVAPAHTDGDAVVHWRRANVIHAGDVFFNGFYPFFDPDAGGTINGMIAAADRMLLLANPGTKIIPGHGPMADEAALQRYRDMLVGVRASVRRAMRGNRTLAQVKASKPTAAWDAQWGKGFLTPDQFVELVYHTIGR